jgi:hypothetical protein
MLFAHDGHLIRPAQDCSKVYGGAIQLCSITALNEQRLEQAIVGRIEPIDRNRFWGAHTYNIGAGVEVVDVFGCRGSEQEVVLRRSFRADGPLWSVLGHAARGQPSASRRGAPSA